MALDPIPSVTRVAAARAWLGAPREAPGESLATLRLVLNTSAAGELLGRGDNGLIYRLAPAAGDTSQFQPGQTLLVQVLRAGPPLEVRLMGTLPSASDAGSLANDAGGEPPAVRPDQAAILRLAAAPSEPKAQAAHWRQLALVRVRQDGTVLPADSAMLSASPLSAATSAVRIGAQEAEAPLLLRVPPWHGWPLMLWLAPRPRSYSGSNRRARRRQNTRLGLALTLPGWGTIGLLFDVLDQQVGLNVVATRAETVPLLRDKVSTIAARLGKAGLRLMRCHVQHEPGFAAPAAAPRPSALAEHELPLVLFRAATEALEALRADSGTAPPHPFAGRPPA